jgi:hypothetical protein
MPIQITSPMLAALALMAAALATACTSTEPVAGGEPSKDSGIAQHSEAGQVVRTPVASVL